MTLTSILILVAIGLVAGWLAGMIWKGGGFGILWNIIIGVAGSFLGGWIFRLLGISYGGIIGSIVAALVVNLIRRRR